MTDNSKIVPIIVKVGSDLLTIRIPTGESTRKNIKAQKL